MVVIKLLTTSPVVSWRAQLSFFAQPPLSNDLSLRVVLPFVCIFVYVLVDGLVSLRFVLGWGAKDVVLSCPHWTGTPTQLALGVGERSVQKT